MPQRRRRRGLPFLPAFTQVTATATVMNLLAAGAAFGEVAIFQSGRGLHLLNLSQAGPVESFLPVPMLSVLSWTTRCSWSPGSARNGLPAAMMRTFENELRARRRVESHPLGAVRAAVGHERRRHPPGALI